MESAEHREMPFGVASLLLGGAMVLFAARSMGFREGSRSTLVQVLVVHAGIVVAAFLCSRDVTAAETAFWASFVRGAVMTHGLGDAEKLQQAQAAVSSVVRTVAPLRLLLSVAFSGLIVLALTRPRARAFFREPAARSARARGRRRRRWGRSGGSRAISPTRSRRARWSSGRRAS